MSRDAEQSWRNIQYVHLVSITSVPKEIAYPGKSELTERMEQDV